LKGGVPSTPSVVILDQEVAAVPSCIATIYRLPGIFQLAGAKASGC